MQFTFAVKDDAAKYVARESNYLFTRFQTSFGFELMISCVLSWFMFIEKIIFTYGEFTTC